jgi:hypothetical protein
MGLMLMSKWYFSGMTEIGYTTGLAYIQAVVINPKTKFRSLYFVVNEDIKTPTPIPRDAHCNSKRGNNNTHIDGLNSKPSITK